MEKFTLKIFSFIIVTLFTSTIVSNSDADQNQLSVSQNVDSRLNRDLSSRAQNTDYFNLGQSTLSVQLNKNHLNKNIAKNIILFIGDGMSISTQVGARTLKNDDEESTLSFEHFPYTGIAMTKCASTDVSESACTATAYLCGVQGNLGTIGLKSTVSYLNCLEQNNTENHTESLAAWAQNAGKSTGVVTTTDITSASPAGVYAHTANRYWFNDQDVIRTGNDQNVCTDIARQLIESSVGHKLNVILGGGQSQFLPLTVTDNNGKHGNRGDGRNLIKQWLYNHKNNNCKFVQTRNELLNITKNEEYIFGLFNSLDMRYHMDNVKKEEPTLDEMVNIAVDIMEQNENGYFLFVEGGRIDHAHHGAKPVKAIDETIELEKAIDLAKKRTNDNETLIIVSADHSQTMIISGYSKIDSDTFYDKKRDGLNNVPYSTVVYGNGITRDNTNVEQKILQHFTEIDKDYKAPVAVPVDPNTYVHGNDDVGVYASGPWAHIFTGLSKQSFIPHGMAFAACIGNGRKACDNNYS